MGIFWIICRTTVYYNIENIGEYFNYSCRTDSMETIKISARIDKGVYDFIIGNNVKISDAINEGLVMYIDACGMPVEVEPVYVKNLVYWKRLKQYKDIVAYEWDTIYVDWEGDVEKGIVLERLGLDVSIFDKNDL